MLAHMTNNGPGIAPVATLCDESEVLRIAEELAAKYGRDAVAFATARAARANAIGDALAHGIWTRVLAMLAEVKTSHF